MVFWELWLPNTAPPKAVTLRPSTCHQQLKVHLPSSRVARAGSRAVDVDIKKETRELVKGAREENVQVVDAQRVPESCEVTKAKGLKLSSDTGFFQELEVLRPEACPGNGYSKGLASQ